MLQQVSLSDLIERCPFSVGPGLNIHGQLVFRPTKHFRIWSTKDVLELYEFVKTTNETLVGRKLDAIWQWSIRPRMCPNWRTLWAQRVAFYGFSCRYCKTLLTTSTLVREHGIPISRGGLDIPANWFPSCARCNKRKGSLTFIEYMLKEGRLRVL